MPSAYKISLVARRREPSRLPPSPAVCYSPPPFKAAILATAANEHGKHALPEVLHGNKRRIFGFAKVSYLQFGYVRQRTEHAYGEEDNFFRGDVSAIIKYDFFCLGMYKSIAFNKFSDCRIFFISIFLQKGISS